VSPPVVVDADVDGLPPDGDALLAEGSRVVDVDVEDAPGVAAVDPPDVPYWVDALWALASVVPATAIIETIKPETRVLLSRTFIVRSLKDGEGRGLRSIKSIWIRGSCPRSRAARTMRRMQGFCRANVMILGAYALTSGTVGRAAM